MPTQKTANKEQVRNLDRIAIEQYKIPGIILMENAGIGAANIIISSIGTEKNVAIFCGKGNNGGDGFVVARHLYNSGITPHIFFLGETQKIPQDTDAGINFQIIVNMKLNIIEVADITTLYQYKNIYESCGCVVDAIFGTGLCRDISSPILEIMQEINSWNTLVIALDTPSGLDCDSGKILGVAIKAQRTITFALAKKGFYTNKGPKTTGEIDVVSISVPKDEIDALGPPTKNP